MTTKKKKKPAPVVMAPNVFLKVSLEIIASSVPKDSGRCMISEAIKLIRPRAKRIETDLQTIRWTEYERDPSPGAPIAHRYVYLTPRPAQKALVAFDYGIVPDPFSILLRHGQAMPVAAKSDRLQKMRRDQMARHRARIVITNATNVNERRAVRVGGAPPPTAHPRGTRRQLGLRAFIPPVSPTSQPSAPEQANGQR